jgi:excisionase family DNA binding protein
MERTHVGPAEVARRLGVSSEHVGDLIRAGLLRASNVGLGKRPQWRIALEDLDAFLTARANRIDAAAVGNERRAVVGGGGGCGASRRSRRRVSVGEEFVQGGTRRWRRRRWLQKGA